MLALSFTALAASAAGLVTLALHIRITGRTARHAKGLF